MKKLGGKRDGLRMVARGIGDDTVTAGRFVKPAERIEGTAELESTDPLQVLALEEHAGTRHGVGRVTGEHGRTHRNPRQTRCCRLNIMN